MGRAAGELHITRENYAWKGGNGGDLGRRAGKRLCYVYRNETLGAAIKMPVALDGKLVGDTAAKTDLLLEVDPGPHTVVSKTENGSAVTVNAVAGRNYFLWQEVKLGLISARSNLQEVDEATGRAGVAECRLIQPPS
ncbi:MAG TPA: DUF2846 domain-containing protein [Burkholderiales bacterium]